MKTKLITVSRLSDEKRCTEGGQTEIKDETRLSPATRFACELEKDHCSTIRIETLQKCETAVKKVQPSRKEWEEFKNDLNDATMQLGEKSMQALGPRLGLLWYQYKICDLNNTLKDIAVNRKEVLAWHVMSRSTTTYEDSPVLDLPKPLSVGEYVTELLQELEDRDRCLQYLDRNRQARGNKKAD